MEFQVNKLKKVLTIVKAFNNTKNLGIDDFKQLNLYFRNNKMYIVTFGEYYASNKMKLIYKFDGIHVPFTNVLFNFHIDDFLNALKFFDTSVDLDFRESYILLTHENSPHSKFEIKRLETNESIEQFIIQEMNKEENYGFTIGQTLFTMEQMVAVSNQLKFRNLDKQDSNNYINFSRDFISVQQFNYFTSNNNPLNITGRIPTEFLKLSVGLLENTLPSFEKTQTNEIIFKTNDFLISIENIDDNFHDLDSFEQTTNIATVNKQELLRSCTMVETFSKEQTFFFKIENNRFKLSNVSDENVTEGYSTVVQDKIVYTEPFTQYDKVFGVNIPVFKGLVGLIDSDEVKISVEQDTQDTNSYLCYITDDNNKNVCSVDIYS